MSSIKEMKCDSCTAEAPHISDEELAELMVQIPEWLVEVREGIMQLERVYKFKNFRLALAFANRVGEIAEKAFHHPALLVEWGKVTVTWWSHEMKGLHKNDLIMAARTDEVLEVK